MPSVPPQADLRNFRSGPIKMTFYGELSGINVATFCDLWPNGLATPDIPNPAAGAAMEIVSSQATDDCTVVFYYINADAAHPSAPVGAVLYEQVQVNGLVPVALQADSTSIIKATVANPGTGTRGDLTIRTVAGPVPHMIVEAAYDDAETFNVVVPEGFKARILNTTLGASSTASAICDMRIVTDCDKNTGTVVPGLRQMMLHCIFNDGVQHFDHHGDFDHPIGGPYAGFLTPGSTIRVQAKRSAGAQTVNASAMVIVEFYPVN